MIQTKIILVGEIHGTREIPAFVSGLVCSLLRDGRSVILAIERDGTEQEGLNRYLESDGAEADRTSLMEGERWKSKFQDGRASQAMLALIENMRQWRRAGQRVGVLAMQLSGGLRVPMDEADNAFLTPSDSLLYSRINDSAMADNVLSTVVQYRRYTLVVLAGARHTSTLPGSAGGGKHDPMGYLVSTREPSFTIGVSSGGGTAWNSGPKGYKEYERDMGDMFINGLKPDALVRLPKISGSPAARPPSAGKL
jgi:erythromycin esterase-like protein